MMDQFNLFYSFIINYAFYHQWKLVLDYDGNSDGEGGGESVKGSVVDPCQQAPPGVPAPPLTMPHSSPFSESYENVCAQPIINPI